MPGHTANSDNANKGISTIDAAHIHFREKEGPLLTYRCCSCSETFQADSRLAVMEHYVRYARHHSTFHSPCFYCGGKVHKYVHATSTKHKPDEGQYFYHDCSRWKRREDR